MTTQIYLEPEQATKAAGDQRAQAGVKTILLHVQNDKSLDSRVQTALALARSCEAHLSCVHITPDRILCRVRQLRRRLRHERCDRRGR